MYNGSVYANPYRGDGFHGRSSASAATGKYRGAAQRAKRRAARRFPTFGISPLRRATLGARPSGYRPSGGGNAPRRSAPPQRGGKRVSGRFYAFLCIVALIIIAVVLLIWRPWASNPDPVDPGVIAATPAAMAPAADATAAPDAQDASDAQAENGAEPQTTTALSDLLGSENTEIAGLTDDQMVQVPTSRSTPVSPRNGRIYCCWALTSACRARVAVRIR